MDILSDLKRRNVHRMAGLYLVGSWLIVQVAATIFPVFGFGDLAVRITVIVLAAGFVPALVLAWVFELTPEGLKRERDIQRIEAAAAQTGRRMDRLIMAVLAVAVGYFALDKFVLAPRREAVRTEEARQEGRSAALAESYGDKSIAVLPFVDLSPDKD